jgi:translation initiation factor 2 alpha subunit (eIF-2alpha)
MDRKEHLLTILAEECNETAQRASKALRFTMEEIQPGQDLTNAERLLEEFNQLYAMFEMLQEEGHIGEILNESIIKKKKLAVEKYLNHSKVVGTLSS